MPKLSRYSLGIKIDDIFTDIIQLALRASYAPRDEKIKLLQEMSYGIDSLKYFIKILWEIKAIDTNKYADLGNKISSIGKMTGGWLNTAKQPRT